MIIITQQTPLMMASLILEILINNGSKKEFFKANNIKIAFFASQQNLKRPALYKIVTRILAFVFMKARK